MTFNAPGLLMLCLVTLIAPFQVRGVIADPPPPPPTFEQLWDKVSVVALVRLGPARSKTDPGRPPQIPPVAMREYEAELIEIFKGEDRLADRQTVIISRYGGTVLHEGRTVTTHHEQPVLHPGDTMILFLVPGREDGRFQIGFGAAGLFLITKDRVLVPAAVQQMPSFAAVGRSMSLPEFVSLLRSMPNR